MKDCTRTIAAWRAGLVDSATVRRALATARRAARGTLVSEIDALALTLGMASSAGWYLAQY